MTGAAGSIRAVLSDDGREIRLTVYASAEVLAAAALDPVRAIGLGAELVAAGYRRLSATPPTPGKRRRGGDPLADRRARRDEALNALAALIDVDAPVEQRARTIADRLSRYRPMPAETSAARQLMREIIDTGLSVPGPDRLARILRHR